MTIGVAGVLIVLAAGMLLFATLHDIAFRTIPNWLSAMLAVDGGVLRLLDHDLLAGIGCGLVIFALAAICWWRGWLGGGDVKLLAATALLVPPPLVPGYVVAVALAGGVLALLYLLLARLVPAPRRYHSASLLWRVVVVECRRIRRQASLPYATAISAAAILMIVKG